MLTRVSLTWKAAVQTAVLVVGVTLAACSNTPTIPPPSEVPLSKETISLLAKKGMQVGSPIFVRIFKEESELEVWKQRDDGRFYHFKTYPICNWSGEIGPKLNYGDRQAPEGFYSVTPGLMNPNSKYYLSFNLGYPNAYDRAWSRTGDSVMVHGNCRSAGCYAMTDALMEEIYGLTREALKADHAGSALFPFLRQLVHEARTKQDLTEALDGAGVTLTDATRQTAAELQRIFAELLTHAQEAGVVRTDVDGQDAQAIVLAAVTAERRRADRTRPGRLADLVLDSLRPSEPAR